MRAVLLLLAMALSARGEPPAAALSLRPGSLPPGGGRWSLLVVGPDSLAPARPGILAGTDTLWAFDPLPTTREATLWTVALPPLRMGSPPVPAFLRTGGRVRSMEPLEIRMPPALPDSQILPNRVEAIVRPGILLYPLGRPRVPLPEVGIVSGTLARILDRLDVVGIEKVAWVATEEDTELPAAARRTYRFLLGSAGHCAEAIARILEQEPEIDEARPVLREQSLGR